ncbi:HEPN domain-containing protein [Geoglobus acetivorans]
MREVFLEVAREAFKMGYTRPSSFHAHQSVERLLKAFLHCTG